MATRQSALLTDLCQLNMMAAYLEHGITGSAVFELFVRKLPSRRGFLMAAGLEQALQFLETVTFTSEDIDKGHGDLRPEHICLGSMPRIIDCLEFRLDLRCLDPLDELAFLAMECERLGAGSIGRVLFWHYCRRTGDCPPPVLIAFYKVIGALTRARIAILHLSEIPVRDPAKWPKRAADYLAIARRECRHLVR